MGVHASDPYLAETRRSTRNQLTGGEETPGESTPQRALLLRCWGPRVAAAGGIRGTEEEWTGYKAGAGTRAGAAVEAGSGVGHVGRQVGAPLGAEQGGSVRWCRAPAP